MISGFLSQIFCNKATKRLMFTSSLILILTGCCIESAYADGAVSRWNQEEAVCKVNSVLTQEATQNFAWNKIKWITDCSVAEERARVEQKPIFLYFFLKGKGGPAEEHC
jgi:hypothetical protein